MKLASLTLSGFQCFAPTPTTISFDDVTYLLGPNGAGKTSVLLAMARMFAVDQSMRGVRVQDFHVASQQGQVVKPADVAEFAPGEAGAVEGEASSGGVVKTTASAEAPAEDDGVGKVMSELWIEAEFVLPEAQQPEGPNAPAVPEFLFQMRLEDVEGPMRLRIRLTATLDGEDEVEERLEFVLSRDTDGNPTKTQPMNGYARRRIQLHYLPARRNPKEQISYAPGSLLGNALRSANWKAENEKIQAWNAEITKSLAANPAIEAIGSQLTSNWGQLHKGDHYTSPTIGFGQSDLDLLLRQLTVNFGPSPQGSSSSFDMLSDGQQSLLYLTTVLSIHEVGRALLANSAPWLSEEKFRPAVFTLLAFEEPENSLSPFYLGRVLNLLKASAGEPDCQAVIATHAPAVVRRVPPAQIRYLRLNDARSTVVREVELPDDADEANKYIQQAVAAYPELYFARLVVLGEGASEEVFLPRLFSASNTQVDAHSIAVVPLGGRHVNHMWRLLNGLGIPHVTLLDLDHCRFGGGWGRVRTTVKNLKAFADAPGVQARLTEVDVAQLPPWSEPNLPGADVDGGWLQWLETANVFFSAPLDLDFMLLEHFAAAYPGEAETPEGDTSDGSPDQEVEGDPDTGNGDVPVAAVLGKKGLDPSGIYSESQLELLPRYRALFLLGSKPSAHLTAMANLTDHQLMAGLPPVMNRLLGRVAGLLAVHAE